MKNNLSLPSSSLQEDLETISRNKFALLFDVKLFELRPEIQRDKGIDITIEIKKDNQYTNFRFAIQLKSTSASEFNKDGSISFPIETNNISYLLNCGMPTYYVLYEHNSGNFYIEQTVAVYQNLIKKYQSKAPPATFNVRFHKLISFEIIQEVYQNAFINGEMLKQIKIATSGFEQKGGITIDSNNRVFSVEENIAFINQYGLLLLNETRFDQIIEIEQKTHPRTKASAMFNLVCGVAYFQRANIFKALELLKLVEPDISVLRSEIKSMFTYTFLQAKHLLGMLNEKDFTQQISNLFENDNIGSFLEIERAYKLFFKGKVSDAKGIQALYKSIENILLEEPDNPKARIMAYAYILDVESKVLNKDFLSNIAFVIRSVRNFQETNIYNHWLLMESEYSNRLNALAKFAWDHKSFLSLGNITMTKTTRIYSKIYMIHIVKNWNMAISNVNNVELEKEDLDILLEYSSKLDSVAKGYESLQHKENLISCLFSKYEMLHFANKMDEAQLVSKKILNLIVTNDLNGIKARYEDLLNGGTNHEKFIKYYAAHIREIYKIAKKSGIDDKYVNSEFTKEMYDSIHSKGKWSISNFFQFNFPNKI